MADGVSKTIAFLATYCDELVQLQKPTLEALLKSNRAKQAKEWNAAKNFWYRQVPKLAAEQRELLDEWEFVLCDVPTVDFSRMQRGFDRSHNFLVQHAEAIKQVGGKTLQEVLRSRKMKADCMAVFARLLLKFTEEQKDSILTLEAELYEKSEGAQPRAEARRATAFVRLQFF